jgi:alkaline phosphatase
MDYETHGGEDVPIYASGPWAHLFHGTVDQQYIFHVMNFAAQLQHRAAPTVTRPRVGKTKRKRARNH